MGHTSYEPEMYGPQTEEERYDYDTALDMETERWYLYSLYRATCEGDSESEITYVPLMNSSGGYREWEVVKNGERYCIVDEENTWTLLKLYGLLCNNDWRDIGYDTDIDAFLEQHNLKLCDE